MVATTSQIGSFFKITRTPTAPSGRAATSMQEAIHDAELVRRFNAGDEDAFVEIVNRYRGKIFSIALCHLRNHADAEEIAQDTFIRAHRGLARFRGDSSLATWLHPVSYTHLDVYKRQRVPFPPVAADRLPKAHGRDAKTGMGLLVAVVLEALDRNQGMR